MDVLLVTVLNTVERQLAETDGPMAWQYLKTFGEAEVGRRHFSGIWSTLQLRPMLRRMSLATAFLLCDVMVTAYDG